MAFALEAGDRRYADRVLVQATRWLRRREGDDPVVRQAREEQRRGFLPARQAHGRHGRGFPPERGRELEPSKRPANPGRCGHTTFPVEVLAVGGGKKIAHRPGRGRSGPAREGSAEVLAALHETPRPVSPGPRAGPQGGPSRPRGRPRRRR